MATHVYSLKSIKPSLCGKERRRLGEYIVELMGKKTKYDPGNSTIVAHKRFTARENFAIMGFIAGMNGANYWADDDADIEDQDASE